MSDVQPDAPKAEEVNNSATPKRTPSKRKSALERHKAEAEEVLKNMGASLELDGKRRTRSSLKASTSPTVATPPPAKKAKTSPTTATTPSRRGRKKAEPEPEEKVEEKPESNGESAEDPKSPVKKSNEEAATVDEKKTKDEDKVDSTTVPSKIEEKKLETVHENNVEEESKTEEKPGESDKKIEEPAEKMEVDEPAETKPNSTSSDAIQTTPNATKTPEKKETITSPPPPVVQKSPVKEVVEPKPVESKPVEETPVVEKKEEIGICPVSEVPVTPEKSKETPKSVEEPAKNGDATCPVVTEDTVAKEPEVVKEVPTVTVTEPTPVKACPVIEETKVETPTNEPALAQPPTETEKPVNTVVTSEPTVAQ